MNNEKNADAVKAPKASSAGRGKVAQLFLGTLDASPERGPSIDIDPEQFDHAHVVKNAILMAAGFTGTFFNLLRKTRPEANDRVFVFSPLEFTETHFIQAAACAHDQMTLELMIRAKRNLKWIRTDVRGNDFIAYLRTVLAVSNPRYVLVSPLEHYFGGASRVALERKLLNDTGWILPPQHRVGAVPAVAPAYRDSAGYEDDGSDKQDWWKK